MKGKAAGGGASLAFSISRGPSRSAGRPSAESAPLMPYPAPTKRDPAQHGRHQPRRDAGPVAGRPRRHPRAQTDHRPLHLRHPLGPKLIFDENEYPGCQRLRNAATAPGVSNGARRALTPGMPQPATISRAVQLFEVTTIGKSGSRVPQAFDHPSRRGQLAIGGAMKPDGPSPHPPRPSRSATPPAPMRPRRRCSPCMQGQNGRQRPHQGAVKDHRGWDILAALGQGSGAPFPGLRPIHPGIFLNRK